MKKILFIIIGVIASMGVIISAFFIYQAVSVVYGESMMNFPKIQIDSYTSGLEKVGEDQLSEEVRTWISDHRENHGLHVYSLGADDQVRDFVIYCNASTKLDYSRINATVYEEKGKLEVFFKKVDTNSEDTVEMETIVCLRTKISKENIQLYYEGQPMTYDYTAGPGGK